MGIVLGDSYVRSVLYSVNGMAWGVREEETREAEMR